MSQVEPNLADLLESMPPWCRLLVEQDEGPYHRDIEVERRDITEGREGVPLRVGLRFLGPSSSPLVGALVEVWQADAGGAYSGFPAETSAPGETFLRGSQHTDSRGLCAFDTIYPGWYPGRTAHIHLIAHVGESGAVTTQLFFPDTVTDEVLPGRNTQRDASGTRRMRPTASSPTMATRRC